MRLGQSIPPLQSLQRIMQTLRAPAPIFGKPSLLIGPAFTPGSTSFRPRLAGELNYASPLGREKPSADRAALKGGATRRRCQPGFELLAFA